MIVSGNIRSMLCMCLATLAMVSCDICDDLPLPLVRSEIAAFEVEGQCDEAGEDYADAVIDKEKRTVKVYVNDLANLRSLPLKNLEVTNDASVCVETANGQRPLSAFATTSQGYPLLDFSDGLTLVLTTYQTYRWTITARQVVNREVVLANQVGRAVIDTVNHNVVVNVASTQDLRAVRVVKFMLGGKHGTVSPDPTGTDVDFTKGRKYWVREACSSTSTEWTVYVYNADASQTASIEVFPHSVRAYATGHIQSGSTPVVQYRTEGTLGWTDLPAGNVIVGDVDFKATFSGLAPATSYECRVKVGDVESAVVQFETAAAVQLPNSSFDEWSIVPAGKQDLYQPWATGATPFWDTGNRGATTVGASNSTSGTEGERVYANLQSKFIVIKFAAGNIFTGKYLKTDGTNGVLSFGQPFECYPTGLRFDFTYHMSLINRGGNKWDENYSRYISRETYDGLRGQPDSCQVYVALIGDQDEETYDGVRYPMIIRTRPSELKLFSPAGDNVIAYAEMTQGSSVEQWTTKTLDLQYRHIDRKPKYIIVVASSSKYGDYFIGGDESLLRLDNVQLLYE